MQIYDYLYDPSVFHFQLFQLGLSFKKNKNKNLRGGTDLWL